MSDMQGKDGRSSGEQKKRKEIAPGGVKKGVLDLGSRLKSNRFKCDICGNKFRLSEKIKHKNRCYECYHAMRDVDITCPKCGRSYALKNMKKVNVYVRPGKKGGKKYATYYCLYCIGGVDRRCKEIYEKQEGEIKEASKVQRRNMRRFIK